MGISIFYVCNSFFGDGMQEEHGNNINLTVFSDHATTKQHNTDMKKIELDNHACFFATLHS